MPNFEALGLPQGLARLAQLPRGLVLVVGAAGSSKSTTLAAMEQALANADSQTDLALRARLHRDPAIPEETLHYVGEGPSARTPAATRTTTATP